MTTYAIALINITAPDKLNEYRTKAAEALAKHGGSIVTGGPVADVLETKLDKPDVVALLQFPSKEAARAWRNDPDLFDVHALRNSAGASSIFVLTES